jgi:subtilase family serine protease
VLTLFAAAATIVVALGMSNQAFAAAPSAASTSTGPAATAAVTTQHSYTNSCVKPTAKRMMYCFALRRTDVGVQAHGVMPNATPSGYGPSSLISAYKLSTAGGSGATVAIVDAQDDPNAESDLATYRSQYGLSACTTANGCFRKVNQNGATSPLPTADTGWAGEISLDVDMVSAICPNCHILLIEANSASDADLYAAEDRAVTMGAKYVSNSWGGGEYSGQTTDDSHFNHPGVAITVSSGDNGNGAEYPATSRYVTAVGGTSLNTSTNSRGWTESAWSGAGSGCSGFDTKPTWQTVTTGCTRRAEADVSAVADPNTGVAVYQTYGGTGWAVYGGTSASSPIIASVYALAGTPGATDYPASYPYSHTANLFDVTSGSNGTCGAPMCTAGTGWDGPTGLGTPNGTAAFTAGGGSTTLTLNNPGNQTGTVGTAVSLTLTASGGTTPYSFSATGLPTGLAINASSGTINGTPSASGTFTVNATVNDSASHTSSVSFTWTINPTGGGCTGAGQKFGNPGFETGTASPWTATAGVIDSSASEPAHTGSWKAWMDGYGTTHTDSISQSVTIPTGCTASLSFYLHIDTAETTTTTQYDKLTVTVNGTSVKTFSNLNHNTGYTLQTVPLSGYTGAVTVKFTGTEDVSLQTSFVVDDTAFNVS